MVSPAERHREFVADLATERPGLHEPKMMGVRGLPPTDEAGLRGDELEMRFIAVTPRFANREHAFINATTDATARVVDFTRCSRIVGIQLRARCGGSRQHFGRSGVLQCVLLGNRWA